MNYGYATVDSADPGIELTGEPEDQHHAIQLYFRVAGAVNLRGKDVLEVGGGRGGRAAYVMSTFAPRSLTALDFSEDAVAFCQSYHQSDGLSFVCGDAEDLKFPDESFDAVLNLESSHCYGSMERFLSEVFRVLRPGGNLLFADMIPRDDVEALHMLLGRTGMVIVEEEEITPNVLLALELTSNRKLIAIRRNTPRLLRPFLSNIAATRGSPIYNALLSGEMVYVRLVGRKP
jgi:SAM-dependent methyltransferase